MSDDVADRADVIIQGCSHSIFAPESLADIKCRLSFIEASECNCVEGPHENALHDLVRDDVPVLLKVVDQLAAELKTTRAQLRQLSASLEEVWDDGNCTGLDGWIGPGRGTAEPDRDALHARDRVINKVLREIDGGC